MASTVILYHAYCCAGPVRPDRDPHPEGDRLPGEVRELCGPALQDRAGVRRQATVSLASNLVHVWYFLYLLCKRKKAKKCPQEELLKYYKFICLL